MLEKHWTSTVELHARSQGGSGGSEEPPTRSKDPLFQAQRSTFSCPRFFFKGMTDLHFSLIDISANCSESISKICPRKCRKWLFRGSRFQNFPGPPLRRLAPLVSDMVKICRGSWPQRLTQKPCPVIEIPLNFACDFCLSKCRKWRFRGSKFQFFRGSMPPDPPR